MAISSFVESIQYVELALDSSTTAASGTLNQSQTSTNCIPFFTVESDETNQNGRFFDAYFTSTHINFERSNATGAGTVKCYVVEFNPTQVNVQQGSFSIDTATLSGTATLGTTLSGINKSAFVMGWKSDGTDYIYSKGLIDARFLNEDTIMFERGITGANISGHYFLFEDLGTNFSVDHYFSNESGTTAFFEMDNYFDPFRCFMLVSMSNTYPLSTTYIGRYTCKVTIPSEKFIRMEGAFPGYENRVAIQIVRFLDTTKVYVPFTLGYRTTGSNTSFIIGGTSSKPLSANLTTSTIVHSAAMGLSPVNMGGFSSTVAAKQLTTTYELEDANTISVYTTYNNYDVENSDCYAIDWAGVTVSGGVNNNIIEEGTGQNQSFVKSVEHFEIDFTEADTFDGYHILTKGQDIDNCIIFANSRPIGTATSYLEDSLIASTILPPNIVYVHASSVAQGVIESAYISVIEFWPNQVKVQRGQSYMTTTEATKSAVVDRITDPSKILVYSNIASAAANTITYPTTVLVRNSFDEAPTYDRRLGYNFAKTCGGTQIGTPVENSDYYTFNGTDQSIEWPTSYTDETSIELKARFRPHNITKGAAQTIWKSGDGTSGLAIGFDASNNIGIFGRSASALTSITVPSTSMSNNKWYRLYATQTEILLYDEEAATAISGSGSITAANGTGFEAIGGSYTHSSPISNSTGTYFEGDVAYIGIFESGKVDVTEPLTVSGTSYIHFDRASHTDSSGANVPIDISYWVIEDLQNNFFVKHAWYSGTSTTVNFFEFDKEWTRRDTFVLGSFYIDAASDDPDDAGHAIYFRQGSNPAVTIRNATAGTSYTFISAFKFLTGKIHCLSDYYTVPSSDLYLDITYDSNYDSNALAAVLGHTQGLGRYYYSSPSYWGNTVLAPSFYNYGTNTVRLHRGGAPSASYETSTGLSIIDWKGYKNRYSASSRTHTNSVIQSYEEFVFEGTDMHHELVLSKGQDISKCLPFVMFSMTDDSYEHAGFVFRNFDDDDVILLNFGSGSGSGNIVRASVVEFGDGVTIQHGTICLDGTTVCVDINTVVLDRAFLMCSATYRNSPNANFRTECAVRGKFVNSSRLEFTRYTGNTSVMEISWYVTECTVASALWTVQHLSASALGGGSQFITADTVIDPTNSFIVGTWSSSAATNDPDDSFTSISVGRPNSVELYRFASYNADSVNVEVITFSEELESLGLKILPCFIDRASNTTQDHDLSESFDLNRSMIINGANSGECTLNYSSPSYTDYCFICFEFKDSDTITSYNGSAYSSSFISYTRPQIIQFPQYNTHYLEGYVQEEGSAVQRTVRAYRASTGDMISETTSVSGTGYFLLETPYSDEHYVVTLDDATGTVWNDLIYGQLVPTVISGSFAYNEGWVTTSGFDIGIPLGRQ